MTRYGLRDDQWERIKDWLPGRIGDVGATAQDNRRFVEAVLYRYRALGDWKNTHRRFTRWAKTGVWQQIFEHLAADADNEYAMLDSTIVRAHQHSAGALKKNPRSGHRA
jgi:transposase